MCPSSDLHIRCSLASRVAVISPVVHLVRWVRRTPLFLFNDPTDMFRRDKNRAHVVPCSYPHPGDSRSGHSRA